MSRSLADGCRAAPAVLALLASVGCGNAGNGAAPVDAAGAGPDAPASVPTSDSGPGPDSGSAEAAAVVVHPCSALGAAGVWEKSTPPQFLQIPGASAVDGGTNNTPIVAMGP